MLERIELMLIWILKPLGRLLVKLEKRNQDRYIHGYEDGMPPFKRLRRKTKEDRELEYCDGTPRCYDPSNRD